MSHASRRFVIGLFLLLAGGAGIGWMYGHADWGLLTAALAALLWQARQLLGFERALRTGNFDHFRDGEGIWQQLISRFRFERERAARRKKEYRMLLKEIRKSTNAMPDGAVILNAENEIVACNRAAARLAGLKRKKDRGHRIDNLIRDPGLTELLAKNDFDSTIEMPSPVGDAHWLNARVVPYGADQKLVLLRDVTEGMRLRKMRRDFVANASHELRSPLTVINGYLDMLADDEDIPEAWKNPLLQMRAQAARMRQILGELLELSRVESAGTANSEQAVDILRLIDNTRKALEGHANVAAVKVNAASSAKLYGNSAEIETVIVNLLSNAFRHTPADGQITITWRTGTKGADLIVADTGEGIDPEYIPRLTERFFRVDKGRSREEGGIGLGLAIVKHVLARHDAELFVSSETGVGSEFRCHFPPERLVAVPPIPLAGGG